MTSFGGDPATTNVPGFGSFRIDNSETILTLTDRGTVTINSGSTPKGIFANPAMEVYSDSSNTEVDQGLIVVTDTGADSSTTVLLCYNESSDPTTPALNAQQFLGDGTVKLAGYRDGNTPLLASAGIAGSAVSLVGFAANGTLVKADSLPGIDSGSNGLSTNALGVKTITHNLGTTPTTVIVSKQFEDGAPIQAQTFGEMVEVLRGSITSTSFQVKITDRLGGPLSNTFRTVYYIVM